MKKTPRLTEDTLFGKAFEEVANEEFDKERLAGIKEKIILAAATGTLSVSGMSLAKAAGMKAGSESSALIKEITKESLKQNQGLGAATTMSLVGKTTIAILTIGFVMGAVYAYKKNSSASVTSTTSRLESSHVEKNKRVQLSLTQQTQSAIRETKKEDEDRLSIQNKNEDNAKSADRVAFKKSIPLPNKSSYLEKEIRQIELAELEIKDGDYTQAANRLRRYISDAHVKQLKSEARLLLVRTLIGETIYTEARQVIQRLLLEDGLSGKRGELLTLLGDTWLYENQCKRAFDAYSQAKSAGGTFQLKQSMKRAANCLNK